ncbi:sugar ABC transporter permease [Peribacillus muralis]|uniref:carbohydrate ABC transporter permease n=1 Tax=Peribacillus muralis TaxID=264697 RepID=UPI001F4D8516|nr:sugar ABC transporter permease [Peribacillus muralis]MCK1994739.1 sugar ABC transporter permease [Peribacillus muralis]MCK2015434.1 sugar ABC transporter permease [Peribacillus muralis]
MQRTSWKSKATSSLFVLPYLLLFTVFLIAPIVYGVWISMHEWDLLNPVKEFVGLKNYLNIFDSDSYLHNLFFEGLKNTFLFVIFSVPLLVAVGLGLALLLNALPKKLTGIFRTAYFIPYSVSVSIVAIIWLWIFDTNSGLINQYLQKVGFSAIPWLTDIPWAWVSIIIATLWWTIGFNMVIFTNALNEVSEELYEAGSLDGANRWQTFIHITLPTIKPTMLFVTLTSTIASFNIYGQPYLMTRGGPGTSTQVLLMNIVEEGFNQRQLGNAAAMSIMMALIMIIISLVQFRLTREKKEAMK